MENLNHEENLKAVIDYCNHCSQPINIRDLFLQEEENITFGDRLADIIAEFGGSWKFIITFNVFMMLWVVYNLCISLPPDPYPFILLNLVLSTLAALQAPVIMMSQNRQERKDRIRAENDFRVNLVSEIHIQEANKKIEFLINELVRSKKGENSDKT